MFFDLFTKNKIIYAEDDYKLLDELRIKAYDGKLIEDKMRDLISNIQEMECKYLEFIIPGLTPNYELKEEMFTIKKSDPTGNGAIRRIETEEDFKTTVENLKKSKLSQIHTFPYSIRKGTIAEKLEGHLPDKVKEERANIIKKISAEKFEEFLKSNFGTEQEVLIEKRLDRKTGSYKGVTRNYINVLLEEGEFNTLKNVTLTKDNIVQTSRLC